jgi:predicted transcriptional regulator
LSQSEIRALVFITSSKGPVHTRDIMGLNLRRETVYRVISRLKKKGLVERQDGEIVLARTSPAEAFKKLYSAHRASPFLNLLADGRVELLSKLDDRQKSVEKLAEEMGIPSETIYYYLRGFLKLGAVSRSKHGKAYLYSFNYIVWPELKDFVTALLEYQVLRLVPREALLIRSYGNSVLFKSLRPQDATLTSFSVYADYGIELRLRDDYYTRPKRELSIQEIFIHSLDSAESLSHRLYCILFYLKNKEALKDVQHPMMESMRAVLKGESIRGYPSIEEIEDQAELYEIKDIQP